MSERIRSDATTARSERALHPVLTFSREHLSLCGLTAKAFGTLMSLEPAIALLAGLHP
jgi:threonine/homoserine efflux transporter RhtA